MFLWVQRLGWILAGCWCSLACTSCAYRDVAVNKPTRRVNVSDDTATLTPDQAAKILEQQERSRSAPVPPSREEQVEPVTNPFRTPPSSDVSPPPHPTVPPEVSSRQTRSTPSPLPIRKESLESLKSPSAAIAVDPATRDQVEVARTAEQPANWESEVNDEDPSEQQVVEKQQGDASADRGSQQPANLVIEVLGTASGRDGRSVAMLRVNGSQTVAVRTGDKLPLPSDRGTILAEVKEVTASYVRIDAKEQGEVVVK